LALLPFFFLSARRPWAARDFFNEECLGLHLAVVDLAVVDLAVVDLAVVDLAKDPCARANLKAQPARSIEPFASESAPLVNQNSFSRLIEKFTVVSSARIFSTIQY
jgi:hypothetical protein